MDSTTVRALLVRGMLAGIVAGLLAFGLAYFVGEVPLRAALDYESAHSTEPGMEVVSRAMQQTAGLATGVLVFAAAVLLGRRLVPRLGNWNASIVAAGVFVVAIAAAMLILPAVHEMPSDFPANVVWQFRLATAAMQAMLWASFGLLFGYFAERVLLHNP